MFFGCWVKINTLSGRIREGSIFTVFDCIAFCAFLVDLVSQSVSDTKHCKPLQISRCDARSAVYF